jgi:ketosteroid isomerase-like protein
VDPLARLADRLAIEDLNAAFAHHLDRDEVDALLELFTPDAEYSNGKRLTVGQAEIRAFFRSRTAGGPRTARHLYSGLRIAFEGEDRARGTSCWLSFARNEPPPVAYSAPFLVADFEDLYVRGTDGRWRIAKRHIEPIFRDPGGVPPGAPR